MIFITKFEWIAIKFTNTFVKIEILLIVKTKVKESEIKKVDLCSDQERNIKSSRESGLHKKCHLYKKYMKKFFLLFFALTNYLHE